MSVNEKKPPRWMARNSKGELDAMWTLTLVAFVVTTGAYIVSILHAVQVGDTVVSFRAFDGLGYAAVVLVPLLGAYFGRRYTREANETSVAKAQIYAELAKRKLESGAATTVTPTAAKQAKTAKTVDANKLAEQLYDDAEGQVEAEQQGEEELNDPRDEV